MSPKWNKSLARSGAPYTPSWNPSAIVGIAVGIAQGGVVHLTKQTTRGPRARCDGGEVLRTELSTAKEDLKAERTHLDEAEKHATLTERA